ncbi:MAG: four helix bundle protein [Lentimonas sp.]
MKTITRFEDIQTCQHARQLSADICKLGELAKDFGLRDQVRRSAVSIQSNIAEGYGREGNKEFV